MNNNKAEFAALESIDNLVNGLNEAINQLDIRQKLIPFTTKHVISDIFSTLNVILIPYDCHEEPNSIQNSTHITKPEPSPVNIDTYCSDRIPIEKKSQCSHTKAGSQGDDYGPRKSSLAESSSQGNTIKSRKNVRKSAEVTQLPAQTKIRSFQNLVKHLVSPPTQMRCKFQTAILDAAHTIRFQTQVSAVLKEKMRDSERIEEIKRMDKTEQKKHEFLQKQMIQTGYTIDSDGKIIAISRLPDLVSSTRFKMTIHVTENAVSHEQHEPKKNNMLGSKCRPMMKARRAVETRPIKQKPFLTEHIRNAPNPVLNLSPGVRCREMDITSSNLSNQSKKQLIKIDTERIPKKPTNSYTSQEKTLKIPRKVRRR